jgi:hypothetical protein
MRNGYGKFSKKIYNEDGEYIGDEIYIGTWENDVPAELKENVTTQDHDTAAVTSAFYKKKSIKKKSIKKKSMKKKSMKKKSMKKKSIKKKSMKKKSIKKKSMKKKSMKKKSIKKKKF